MSNQHLYFRPDLQGLRAIAILLVILAHAGFTFLPGGFIGVDVFFVLSGYLITGLLLRELEQENRIHFLRFYARRLKRLLPALMVMLCVSMVVAVSLLSAMEAARQLASAPFAASWTSNLYFAFSTLDYFDELAGRDLFIHTWSLGVEEQFYLIWPALLLIFSEIGRTSRFNTANNQKLLMTGMFMAFIASLVLSLYWTQSHPQAAFYHMPSRIWQFALGAIIYISFQQAASCKIGTQTITLGRSGSRVALLAGMLLILASAIWLQPGIAYPGYRALFPSLGAALVILAGQAHREDQLALLHQPAMVWLGDRSYSLYLWHWPILIVGISLGYQDQVLPTVLMVLLALFSASLSYRWIELPFWKGRYSHASPIRIILLCLLVMALMILLQFHGLRQLQQQPRITAESPLIFTLDCDDWYHNARVKPCVFGPESAEKTVVLLGDSIGVQWFSLVQEIFRAPGWRQIVLTKSACALVDVDYVYEPVGQIYQVCTDWRNAVLDELDRIRPHVLVMGSDAGYDFSEDQWLEGSARILERTSKSAGTVFLIPGTPDLDFHGPGCLSKHLAATGQVKPGDCLARDRLKHTEPVTRQLWQAARRYANVSLLNLNDLVCPNGDCSAIDDNGEVIFIDSQHLTDSFVRSLIPIARDRIIQLDKTLVFPESEGD